MLRIAKGNIVERTPAVHGHTLEEDEEKVLICELTNGECTHPEYSYSLEEGGFSSWKRVHIKNILGMRTRIFCLAPAMVDVYVRTYHTSLRMRACIHIHVELHVRMRACVHIHV